MLRFIRQTLARGGADNADLRQRFVLVALHEDQIYPVDAV